MPHEPRSSPPSPDPVAAARAAERAVVLGYVPADARPGIAALLALDDVLGAIVRTTREPIVGQMRLTWWHEALESLDGKTSPGGAPLLAALAGAVVPRGVSGRTLATMIDAWEILLAAEPIDPDGADQFARARGGTLFAAMAGLLGGQADRILARAGEGWALADLAAHLRDPGQAILVRTMAAERFDGVFRTTWPWRRRPIGMLALLARDDVMATSARAGSPRRLGRLLMHRIWGR